MKRITFLLLVLIMVLGLAGCKSGLRVGWISTTRTGLMEASYVKFSDSEAKRFRVDAGKTISADYEVDVQGGDLSIELTGPDGKELWRRVFTADERGDFTVTAPSEGRYQFTLRGDESKGSYSLSWDVTE